MTNQLIVSSTRYTLKKIGALPNPKKGKKGFNGVTKPKKNLPSGTLSKPFVRNLFRFRTEYTKSFGLSTKSLEFDAKLIRFHIEP